MDDSQTNFNNPDTSPDSENNMLQPNDTPPPQDAQEPQPKKKRRGRPLLLLMILLIAAIGGAVGYYRFYRVEPVAIDDSSAQGGVTPQQNLYYQVGSKIVKYNQDNKTTSTLTAAMPKGAEVLDFFSDGINWRAIYQTTPQTTSETRKIALIENGKPAITLVENAEYIAVASAQFNLVAYALPADTTKSSGEGTRTRTFLAKAGDKTEEIFTSNSWSHEALVTDINNYLYVPREISNNGDKLLFNLLSCFQCDGPPLAAAFEMDIKSKEVKPIYLSEEPGYVTFNSSTDGFKGYKVIESNNLSLASDGPYELAISQVDTPGGPAKQEFKATEDEWAHIVFSPSRDYMAIEKKIKTFAETGKTAFDGIYASADAGTPADMTKLAISDFPSDNFAVQSLGGLYGDCFGLSMFERATNNPTTNMTRQEVGVICKSGAGYDYTKIDTIEYDSSEIYQNTKVLNRL